MVTGKSAMALRLMLTCAAVASSTEPVHDGPIQVFIMAGESQHAKEGRLVVGHSIVPAVTQATHALGCPCTQEICCSPAAGL